MQKSQDLMSLLLLKSEAKQKSKEAKVVRNELFSNVHIRRSSLRIVTNTVIAITACHLYVGIHIFRPKKDEDFIVIASNIAPFHDCYNYKFWNVSVESLFLRKKRHVCTFIHSSRREKLECNISKKCTY